MDAAAAVVVAGCGSGLNAAAAAAAVAVVADGVGAASAALAVDTVGTVPGEGAAAAAKGNGLERAEGPSRRPAHCWWWWKWRESMLLHGAQAVSAGAGTLPRAAETKQGRTSMRSTGVRP